MKSKHYLITIIGSIEAEKELNDWVWGRNVNKNEYGWVPLEILEKENR